MWLLSQLRKVSRVAAAVVEVGVKVVVEGLVAVIVAVEAILAVVAIVVVVAVLAVLIVL